MLFMGYLERFRGVFALGLIGTFLRVWPKVYAYLMQVVVFAAAAGSETIVHCCD